MINDLTGKVALITGGAQRAGKDLALTLAKAGADLVITWWKTPEDADQTQKEIEALGRRCLMLEADITNIPAMRQVIADTEKEYGRLDVLVHNAANYNTDPFLQISQQHFDSSMNVILKGPFFLTQAAIPLMLKNDGGKIIAMIGNSSFETWPEKIPHAIAKSSMIKLMEGIAVGFSPKIQCYSVCPGAFFKVDKADYIPEYDEVYHDINGYQIKNGTMPPVAQLVLFLATCDNYLNGEDIIIDGGAHLMRGANFESQKND